MLVAGPNTQEEARLAASSCPATGLQPIATGI